MKIALLALGVLLCVHTPVLSSPFHDDFNPWQQSRIITGKITDDKGEPLANVTVQVKGTEKSVISANDGSYSIEVPAGAKTLVFSYIGMETEEVDLGQSNSLDIRLINSADAMSDVVVVGYATQKKANLTGSVSAVSGKTLTQRPAPNSANLLQGRATGLYVTQPSGEPGRDNPNILIRGRGTFGGSPEPLILIDGVTGSLNNLSPDDIENVTILKDAASASIYGARAANGVILVTTKKGRKGKTLVSYRINFGRHNAIGLPDLITNSADYMQMYNAGAARSGLSPTTYYPQAEIDKYRNAGGSDQYPNFDAVDYYFQPATVVNQNLSVSGGTDQNTFNLSVSYLNEDAFFKQYNFKRYNTLLSYTSKLSDKVTLGTTLNLTYKNRQEPPVTSQFMALTVYATGPLYGPYLPDGSGRVVTRAYNYEGRNRNVSEYYLMGDQYTKEYNLNGQAFLDVKILKNLTWSTKVAVNYVDEFFKMHQVPYNTHLLQEKDATGDYRLFNPFGPDILGVTDQYSKAITPTLYSTLNYNTKIGNDHNINALLGYEQLYFKFQTLRARRQNSVAPAIDEIVGYSTASEFVNYFPGHPRLPALPDPTEWAMRSAFARVNYNYKGKYLLEGNLRYDGTSKVSPDYRWGLFPSVSAGWLMSEENFIRDNFNWVNYLKIRGSYGTLGNQDIGTYLYQNTINTSGSYPFGNTTPTPAAVVNSFKDQSIKWESTSIIDFGFDFTGWNGLLGITFDWFRKVSFDVLATQPIPMSVGLDAPTFNNGEIENKGIELELTHQNKIGEFTYGVNGMISTAHNKVLDIKVPAKGTTIRDIGYPYDAHFLYVWDGIFQTEDIGNARVPRHAANPNPKAGDLKMKDINGDGNVDANDRVVVSGAYPDYFYSFGMNAGYKGFSLIVFFQGVSGIKSRQTAWGVDPFTQGTAPTEKWRDAWTPTNRSNTLPAIYAGTYVGVTSYQGSTFYLSDASYLRLKNIMLSYSLPSSIISKIKSKELTFYVSAENVFTITDFEFGDPERAGISTGTPPYPQARILNVGLNVKF